MSPLAPKPTPIRELLSRTLPASKRVRLLSIPDTGHPFCMQLVPVSTSSRGVLG
ncbi:hypothetical protein B0H17DRAFT_1039487 [Mycena rosella]|uniref:Uncharacterized protein n=1 Tax=Mycena rosella TaxID=1033263 RepID=A0AAD7GSK3_MYCRO|nr:hypothetical protein B0H17DRAFT_1039487 [Mycena rosella]